MRRIGLSSLLLLAATPILAAPVPDFAFAVDVSLSPAAARKLEQAREGIVVDAMFWGEPAAAFRKKADEMGQIDLGSEKVELPGSGGRAVITGRSVQRARLPWIKGHPPQVLVNVYSARHSGPDNLLACDIFEGEPATAAAAPRAIHCKLIGEP